MYIFATDDKKVEKYWRALLKQEDQSFHFLETSAIETAAKHSEMIVLLLDIRLRNDVQDLITWYDPLVFCLSENPSYDEGLESIKKQAKGYGNIFLNEEHFHHAMSTIMLGQLWLHPVIVEQILTKLVTIDTAQEAKEDYRQILTKRENEVAELAVTGLTNKEIASHMSITERTVKAHLSNIYEKLDVHDKFALAIKLK
jgi:DNA-binding NarL/FixJ family response regulator